jgi:hypothetical protein
MNSSKTMYCRKNLPILGMKPKPRDVVNNRHLVLIPSSHPIPSNLTSNLRATNRKPSVPMQAAASSINTLSISINLQSLLRHISILQKVQRHPNKVSLDLVQLLAHHLHRLVHIVQVPRLARPFGA